MQCRCGAHFLNSDVEIGNESIRSGAQEPGRSVRLKSVQSGGYCKRERQDDYIGGQNAIDSGRSTGGSGHLELQTKQVLKNIETILASENAGFADLIKLNIHLLNGCDPQIGYKAFQESVGVLEKPL